MEETVVSKQCIFYENRELKEIPADKGANLLMEVQLPKSMNEPGDYKSLGWTFINLFDQKMNLNRGKFKLPLYRPPLIQNINMDFIENLEPVP